MHFYVFFYFLVSFYFITFTAEWFVPAEAAVSEELGAKLLYKICKILQLFVPTLCEFCS